MRLFYPRGLRIARRTALAAAVVGVCAWAGSANAGDAQLLPASGITFGREGAINIYGNTPFNAGAPDYAPTGIGGQFTQNLVYTPVLDGVSNPVGTGSFSLSSSFLVNWYPPAGDPYLGETLRVVRTDGSAFPSYNDGLHTYGFANGQLSGYSNVSSASFSGLGSTPAGTRWVVRATPSYVDLVVAPETSSQLLAASGTTFGRDTKVVMEGNAPWAAGGADYVPAGVDGEYSQNLIYTPVVDGAPRPTAVGTFTLDSSFKVTASSGVPTALGSRYRIVRTDGSSFRSYDDTLHVYSPADGQLSGYNNASSASFSGLPTLATGLRWVVRATPSYVDLVVAPETSSQLLAASGTTFGRDTAVIIDGKEAWRPGVADYVPAGVDGELTQNLIFTPVRDGVHNPTALGVFTDTTSFKLTWNAPTPSLGDTFRIVRTDGSSFRSYDDTLHIYSFADGQLSGYENLTPAKFSNLPTLPTGQRWVVNATSSYVDLAVSAVPTGVLIHTGTWSAGTNWENGVAPGIWAGYTNDPAIVPAGLTVTADRNVVLGSLSVAGTVDLKSYAMVVKNQSAEACATIRGLLGTKIIASGTEADPNSPLFDNNHSLAAMFAGDVASNGNDVITNNFHGQAVSANDVLVQYGWNGDLNMDGAVTYLDYGVIDNAFLSHGSLTGYAHGDLNGDGAINYLDYGMMDNAFLAQNAPAVTAMTATAVPEPALGLLSLAGLALLSRRRR